MKILYVTTVGGTMGFFKEHFKMLLEEGNIIELACNSKFPICDEVMKLNLPVHHIDFSRSPLSKDNFKACKQLKKLIEDEKYDIVHCHTPNAAAVTRLTCRTLRKNGLKVFYTAHGFHFYKGAPAKNWLLYYPVEWLCAFWTDKLITINQEDFHMAQKHMHAKEVLYVPGVGVNLQKFSQHGDINKNEIRQSLGIPENKIWLLSVGELIPRKNHIVLIRALKNNPEVFLTIAGDGQLKKILQEEADTLGVGDRVKLLGYRTDISTLCQAADIFALSSFHEGLPVSLMEAMACGLPALCSRIRGNTDLVDDDRGGLLFDPCSWEDCSAQLSSLLTLDLNQISAYNQLKVKNFDTECVLNKMREVYL